VSRANVIAAKRPTVNIGTKISFIRRKNVSDSLQKYHQHKLIFKKFGSILLIAINNK